MMKAEQDQVREFMSAAGQACPDRPTLATMDVRELRIKLIAEELVELSDALSVFLRIESHQYDGIEANPLDIGMDLEAAYDAILDLLVVVIGTAVALGLPIDPGWEEVHRSNMSKFIDGHRRKDGKWMKGPGWSPPDLKSILEKLYDE